MALMDTSLFIKTTLGLVIGTLAAIVYSLRYLVLMERKIAKMDQNIERLTKSVLSEEIKLEGVEKKIAQKVGAIRKRKPAKKRAKRRK